MSFGQTIYKALRGDAAAPEPTALVLSSRAAGRRLLASVAAECGMLVGVSAETPFSLAAELCAPQLSEPGAPRLMSDDEAAELLLDCVLSNNGLFSAKSAGSLSAVREIARSLRELEMENVPPLTEPDKQTELQALRKAYAAKKEDQNVWDRVDLFDAAIRLADSAPKKRCVTLPSVRFTAKESELLEKLADGGLQRVALEMPAGLLQPWLAPEGAYSEVLAHRSKDNTRIFACMGDSLETERVLRDMAEQGLSFDDCAVIYPAASYAPLLFEATQRFGIPAVFPAGIPIRETRAYAALRLLSELSRHFSEAEDLRRLLISYGCMGDGAPHELAKQLRSYCVGWGDREHYLRFVEQYQADTNDSAKLTAEEKRQRIEWSEHWKRWLTAVFTLSAPTKETTLEDQQDAMALFLGDISGVNKANAVERSAFFTAAELARHVRSLPGQQHLVDWLLQLLDGKSVLSENAAPGKLLCLPLRQALTCGRKNIYAIGLGRDVFAPGVESPVLLDAERSALNKKHSCTLPLRQSTGEEKRLCFLELLLHHEGKLTISYSCFNCDKQIPLLPTLLVSALLARKGEEEIPRTTHTFIPAASAKTLAGTDLFLTKEFTSSSAPKAPKAGDGAPAELEPEKDITVLLDETVFSASSMEMALRCPLQFFYNYLLGERKPEYPIWKISEWLPSNTLGTFCHKVLELYYSEQIASPGKDTAAQKQRLEIIFEAEWEQVKRRSPPPGRLEKKTRDAAWSMIQKAVQWTTEENRRPLATERAFGPGKQDAEIELTAGAQRFKFQGSIDRVDQKADGSYSVVDYKTGSPERLEREKNAHLQHYLYKEAEKTLSGGTIDPKEAGYLLLADETCRFFTRDADADEAAKTAIESMLIALKKVPEICCVPVPWRVQEDGRLMLPLGEKERMDAYAQCSGYCSYRDLCPLTAKADENAKGGGKK